MAKLPTASLGTPNLDMAIDASQNTSVPDQFYLGPLPGPSYLTMATSKVDGVDIPKDMQGGNYYMAKDRMNGGK